MPRLLELTLRPLDTSARLRERRMIAGILRIVRMTQLSGGIRSTISLALALGTGTRGWLRLWESVEHGRTKHSQQGEEEAELYLVREAICPTDNYRLLIVNIILPTSALEDSCNRSVSITSYLQYKRIVLAGDYSYRLARRLGRSESTGSILS